MKSAPLASAGLLGPLVLALGLAWPGAARAQGGDRAALAQGLYDAAAELIKAGRFAEACPKLEESQRLDPAMGTQFFLAGCYEKTGRPTSAWSQFLEVAAAAKAARNTVRENTARARAAALELQLPRLRVALGAGVAGLPGLEVSRDGQRLDRVAWDAPVPVDLGEHVVRARAPGKADWEGRITIRELGQKAEVTVPPLADAPSSPRAAAPIQPGPSPDLGSEGTPAAAPPSGMPGQRVAAIVVGSLGVAGLGAGGALGLLAKSAWHDANAGCPTHTGCSVEAHDQSTRSVSLALGSTIAFAAGGAAVATAVILFATAPSRCAAARIRVVPVASAGAAGAFVTGGF
jgi:hypothetical protein